MIRFKVTSETLFDTLWAFEKESNEYYYIDCKVSSEDGVFVVEAEVVSLKEK